MAPKRRKHPPDPHEYEAYFAYLLELDKAGSINKTAASMKCNRGAVTYNIGILGDLFGDMYDVPEGKELADGAKLTNLGKEFVKKLSSLQEHKIKFFAFAADKRGVALHKLCPIPFPEKANIFYKYDPYPRVKNHDRKILIECLGCGVRRMALKGPCIRKWLKIFPDALNGPYPSFRVSNF